MDHSWERSRIMCSRALALNSLCLVKALKIELIKPSNLNSYITTNALAFDAFGLLLTDLIKEPWTASDKDQKTHVFHETAIAEHELTANEYTQKANELKTANRTDLLQIIAKLATMSQLHFLLAQKHKCRSGVTAGTETVAVIEGHEWTEPN